MMFNIYEKLLKSIIHICIIIIFYFYFS